MDNNILYVCYSPNLNKFLKGNGLRYEIGGKHIETNKPFWVYVRNEKLNSLLKVWSSRK